MGILSGEGLPGGVSATDMPAAGALSCPSGVIGWEGTTSITLSVLFPAHPLFFEVLPKNKYSRNSLNFRSIFLLVFVIQLGFEPRTHSLEGCCSIQLSYLTILIFVVQR